MLTARKFTAALAVALIAGAAGAASAQSYSGYELAPGFGGPNTFYEFEEREVLDGYGLVEGELPDSSAQIVDSGDGALTEFAGQKRIYDPGIVGGVLGSVKNAIIGKK